MSLRTTYVYLTRIIPALSIVAVAGLLFVSFVVVPNSRAAKGEPQDGPATFSQVLLAIYTVVLHLLAMVFPTRLCWATNDVIRRMREPANLTDKVPSRRKMQTVKSKELGSFTIPVPLFVIIIPNYKEDMETLQETLRVLASHSQARYTYDIYLAMEEKEENSDKKADGIIKTFHKSFRRMAYTVHPCGIPGEAQGKSSNEAWAAKQAFRDYPDEVKKNVVMTVMDADTHLSTRYFAQITRHHLESPETNETTFYVPPLVFDRNIHQVPLLVKAADLAWAGAGLSSLYQGSNVCIPTSVYSLPLTLVEHVGGWDTDPGSIGEDMHMYLKCFFALSGNLDVKIIYAAASVCDVSSNVPGWDGYVDGLKARYRQALRHMWGSLDTGYAIRQTVSMCGRHVTAHRVLRDKPSTFAATVLQAAGNVAAGLSTVCYPQWTSLRPETAMHKSLVVSSSSSAQDNSDSNASTSTISSTSVPAAVKPIHKQNLLTLYHRLFEAHFLPVHLAAILASSTIYSTLLGGPVPACLRTVLLFSEISRSISWLMMVYVLSRYDTYHRMCVKLRQQEMLKAGMLEDLVERDAFSPIISKTYGVLEAAIFPVGGFLFGSVPHCQALLSHVFTDRLTYHVSLKPQFALRMSWSAAEAAKKAAGGSAAGGDVAGSSRWSLPWKKAAPVKED